MLPPPSEAQAAVELTLGAAALRASDLKALGVDRPVAPTGEGREAALDRLAALVRETSGTLLDEEGMGDDIVKSLFHRLEHGNAAYWVGKRYVPAAALAVPETLAFLLNAHKRNDFSLLVINQVLGYFDGLTRQLLFPDEKR